ncbi:hypothetical protein BG003_004075 [Podila horticola]|nr:hypothetical protein BG003_004075 [Podila horticola]
MEHSFRFNPDFGQFVTRVNLYKADLELSSANIDVLEPLRKVSAGLAKKFKHDVFVNMFAKLTVVFAERNANQGMRNMFLKVAGNLGTGMPKEIEMDAVLEGDVEDIEVVAPLEGDIEELERFEQMDQTKFWKLASGRTFEQILFEKSIKGGASYK